MMEIVIFVIAAVALALLAQRFGCDSRPTAYSKEEEQAALALASRREVRN
jgi:hypothetical protein